MAKLVQFMHVMRQWESGFIKPIYLLGIMDRNHDEIGWKYFKLF